MLPIALVREVSHYAGANLRRLGGQTLAGLTILSRLEGGCDIPAYGIRCPFPLFRGFELSQSVSRAGLFSSSSGLLAAPKGVMLCGSPGCGKTMLAKALACEFGARFINMHIITLTEKWYGDSDKLASAVGTLARKPQPTIEYVDEINAVLRSKPPSRKRAVTKTMLI